MSEVLAYSDFLTTLNQHPQLRNGLIVDTNVLISATYDTDIFFDTTTQFFDYLIENEMPIYCNVTVRAEFLEIHRRIIFTEMLIDFFHQVDRTLLPNLIAVQLGKLVANNTRRIDQQKAPSRLSESEIKIIKLGLIQISSNGKNLWDTLCESKIGNKLETLWAEAENDLGLVFLSTRNEDFSPLFNSSPEWIDVVKLVQNHGLSSSDAMILNLFFCSSLKAIVSSDLEVALMINKKDSRNKICFIPDILKKNHLFSDILI